MSKNTLFVGELAVAIAKAKRLAAALQCEVTVLHSEPGYCCVRTLDWLSHDGYVAGVETYNYVTTLDQEGR